jgi:nucleotide-binding universal stress UspA family protein
MTVSKILIAYDGSECSEAALDDLRGAGLPAAGVEARVLAVAEVWLPPPPPSMYEVMAEAEGATSPAALQRHFAERSPAFAEARGLALLACDRLRKNFPGWQVSAEALYGSPAWVVVTESDRWRPDLVVVGSHGRTGLGRFVLGSVSQKVLTEARSSVRVGRGRVEVEESRPRLVVGVDGSEGATTAVRAVAERAWPEGAEARVVIVDDPVEASPVGRLIPPVAHWVEETNREERDWVRRVADEAATELRAAGLKAEGVVREGDPKRKLVEEAEAWGADCVFVGSTGFHNRLERFLLGSVSGAVAARAHCTVEVVREPEKN